MNLQYCEKWAGQYKGFYFEISCHETKDYRFDDQDVKKKNWCYYVYIHEKQVPDELKPNFILIPDSNKDYCRYNYYDDICALAKIEWHGGITFYNLENGLIKAGCDFSHIWDEGISYYLEYILSECKRTIDDLVTQYPNLKIRCGYNGKYYDQSVMEPYGDGYISSEGKKEKELHLSNIIKNDSEPI
jgi:hypothetical protein